MFSSLSCIAFSKAATTGAPAGFDKRFRRAAPDHDQAVGAAGFLEVANVVAHLLGQLHLVLALFHVGAVELLNVVLVEHRLARLDRREERLHLLQQRAIEHARFAGGRVHVVFENVPAGEDQIVKPGQRHEIVDLGGAAFGAFAQADGAHLSQRSDGLGDAFAYRFDAGDKRGRDRAHAGDHDSQLALRRRDFSRAGLALFLLLSCRHVYQSVS